MNSIITSIIYIYNSAVKPLIAINHFQNKSFCLHNTKYIYTVFIYYVYVIQTHAEYI